MKLYFVGIAMRSYTHDYGELHSLLAEVDARRVSKRIWLVSVERNEDSTFRRLGSCLAGGDELLVVQLPEHPRWSTMVEEGRADTELDHGLSDPSARTSVGPNELGASARFHSHFAAAILTGSVFKHFPALAAMVARAH